MTPDDKRVREQIESVMEISGFNPPADIKTLNQAEQQLGVEIPSWLRKIYLACDGFRGVTGSRFLYPLLDEDYGIKAGLSIVSATVPLRNEDWAPEWLHRAIVFGDDGIGGTIGLLWCVLDGDLIKWCLGDGSDYKMVVNNDIFEVWGLSQKMMDAIDQDDDDLYNKLYNRLHEN